MKTNKEILNAIRNSQGLEYQANIPLATSDSASELAMALLDEFPTAKNSFLNVLTNRIGKDMFFDKVFNNPYKVFHKGLLPYGKSVQQLFVEMAEKRGVNEHFTGSESAEGDLIKALKPNVNVEFITQNIAYKFKTTISDDQLRGAFNDAYGLNKLLNNVVNSLYSSVNYHEYLDMKRIITCNGAVGGGNEMGNGLLESVNEAQVVTVGTTPQEIAVAIKTWVNKLQFPSNKYNVAQVLNWTEPQDAVVFVTPELKAQLDVNVLAMAFNLNLAEANARIIVMDEIGQCNGKPVKCIVADKDIIQCYDTVNRTGTFENVDQLIINYFAHKQGIMAGCSYANAIVLV